MNKDIQNRFLEHSNPNVVYDWLENNAYKLRAWLHFGDKPEEELMLLERKEPLIDLALALFSRNKEIRNILFDREDSTLQKAVLTNKNCGHFPELENLLKAKNTKYLEILLKNTENRWFLVDLFKKRGIFDNVKKGYWLTLLEFAARNKILEYPYSDDDPEWEDHDADATRLYRAIYRLFDTLEVTNKNAYFLATLVQRLPAINRFHLVGIDELKLIKKWQNKKSVPHSDYLYFYEHKNDWDTSNNNKFTKIEGKCWIERSYVICRTYLANFVSCDEFEDSEDIALRMAYYRNENFNQDEEEVKEILENWSKYRTRDGYLFLESLIKNVSIYYNKKIREFIGEGMVLSRTYYADEYREKLKELQDNNPENFIDNSQFVWVTPDHRQNNNPENFIDNSQYQLEKKLDKEINKKDCDRFVVEDICSEILVDKNTPTNLIRKIYEYIDNRLIELWGSFPYGKLESHKNSPFNIFEKQSQYNHITDILFMSYITDTPEAFSIILNYLRNQKNKKESVEQSLYEMSNPSTDEYKACLNDFRNKGLPKSLYITKKFSNRIFDEETLKMMNHLRAGYNLFHKIDELLFDFKLSIFCTFNEYDYWRIVFFIKLSCSKLSDKSAIINHLKYGNAIDGIAEEFVSTRAGFFARNFCPKFYKHLWIDKVKNVQDDILGHIR